MKGVTKDCVIGRGKEVKKKKDFLRYLLISQ